MIEFFTSAEIAIGTKLLEVEYIIMGLICFFVGLKNLKDKENPSPIGTGIFWISFGVVLACGRWLPSIVNGGLVLLMVLPATMKKVTRGKIALPSKEESVANFQKIGLKIFLPTLCIGLFAIGVAIIFPKISALVGLGIGVLVGMFMLFSFNQSNTPKVFLGDAERLLTTVGPLGIMSMLLAALGSIFTKVGVGELISVIFGNFIPEGNLTIGIIVFGIGMMLFTMIMGNAFAAITVMMVGVGAPFVLNYGADPVVIGMVALTCGYCGTLITPMAANFNIVPVAILEMKDRFGVIKNQIFVAIVMLAVQIAYMIMFS